jgi:hypothetical protein
MKWGFVKREAEIVFVNISTPFLEELRDTRWDFDDSRPANV